jgi:SOS-response transcriptional repressor LexA
VVEQFQALLREVEVTAMTKSFKMVLLEALLELDGLGQPVPLQALAQRSRGVLERRRPLLADLPAEVRTIAAADPAWARYWRDNPVKAWTGGNRPPGTTAPFKLEGSTFALAQSVPGEMAPALAAMLQELVDYRLAAYEVRLEPEAAASNVVPFPAKRRDAVELPYFPNLKIACGHFKTGRTDSEEHRTLPTAYGPLDPSRHFIARATGNSMDGGKNPVRDGDYLLLELMSPTRAGSITGNVVAIERQDESGDNQYLLRVVTKTRDGQYVLKANNPAYEDMPATDEMRTLARLRGVDRSAGPGGRPELSARGDSRAVRRSVQPGQLERGARDAERQEGACAAGDPEQAGQGRGAQVPGPLDRRASLPLAKPERDNAGEQARPGDHRARV